MEAFLEAKGALPHGVTQGEHLRIFQIMHYERITSLLFLRGLFLLKGLGLTGRGMPDL